MKNKKAAFDSINNLMVAFIGFVVLVLLVILLLSTLKSTTLVCGDQDGLPTRLVNGVCQACPSTAWSFNTTANYCCNASATNCYGVNSTAVVDYGGLAYNATKYLQDAALLPPQFASLIIIVGIIIGILGLVAVLGYTAYKKMKE